MTTKNIHQKILAVMEGATYVQKTGYNNFHKYSYAKESDYLEAVRPLLIKEGLTVVPNITKQETVGDITHVQMTFTICNADNNEVLNVTMSGSGQDKGDKGVYKAITGAKKYFISTMFLIPTGDDAEDDGAAPQAPQSPAQKTQPSVAPKSSFRKVGGPANNNAF